MARFTFGLVTGLAIATVFGAALGIRASSSDADVREVSQAAGYDERELGAALDTLNRAGLPTDPWTYARSEGRLPAINQSIIPSSSPLIADKWLRLAQCEASGDWHNARNPVYKGGLQFDSATWARYGGLAFAPRADFATPAQQVLIAERTLAVQGPKAWPLCGPRTGLR